MLLTAFCIPFIFANGLIYIWLALFAFTLTKADFADFKLFSKQNIPQIFILLLYILGVVSLLYTENTSAVVTQLTGQRLLMFLLPLAAIVGLRRYSFFDILKAYILGCLLFLLYLFSFLAWQFFTGMSVELLTDPHYISTLISDEIMHRSYISLNLIISGIAIVYLLQSKQIARKNYPLYAAFLVLLVLVLLYLSSRAALLSLALLLFFYFVYFVRKSAKMLFFFALIFSICFALFFMIPNRLLETVVATSQEQTANQPEEPRIEIWKNAWEVIQNQPFFGQGTGASREVLLQQFEKNNFQYGMTSKLNAHNQYIEYLLEYGWTGLSLFLVALFSIPVVCSRNKRLFYTPFVLVVAVNLFFETMLARTSGVVTFTFFVMLLGMKNEELRMKNGLTRASILHSSFLVLHLILLLFIGYSYYNIKRKDVYFNINSRIERNGVVQLDNRVKSATWERNTYGYSPFLYAKLTDNQRLTVSSEVYVSVDFNGEWAMIALETPNHSADMNSFYDMSQKGMWQRLELTGENLNGEIKAYFYISQYNQPNFDNLQGKVLFRNTTYSITNH